MAAEVPEYEIRQMKKEDIPDVFDLWLETKIILGGTEALNTWFQHDPEGFFVAVTKDGTILGVCAGVINHDDLAVVGMYTVRTSYRGLGIGRSLCDRVRERYGNRNAVANPVTEKHLKDYRDRGGYPIETNWHAVFHHTEKVNVSVMIKNIPGVDVSLVSSDDKEILKAVAEYDAKVVGFPRRVLPLLCGEKDSVTVVARNSEDSSICGYGMIKKNVLNFAFVGPLFADNNIVAELILYHLVKSFPLAMSKGVVLISIDCNKHTTTMYERLGFRVHSSSSRLYSQKEEKADFKKIFAQLNDNFTLF